MIVLDPYTGYRGHKSLGFLSGPSDDIYGIDIDLGLLEWHNRPGDRYKDASNEYRSLPRRDDIVAGAADSRRDSGNSGRARRRGAQRPGARSCG